MIRRRTDRQFACRSRRGFLIPAIAVALLVVMACVALALDRLWLDAAAVELTTVAEAAALAAVGRLASDDLLRDDADPEQRFESARKVAARVGVRNRVAGAPVVLNTSPHGDVRIGRVVVRESTGHTVFMETSHRPTTVVVTAKRTRRRHNPVALLFRDVAGQSAGDVAARAEASIDPHVIGFRPFDGAPAPALPLAILARDLTGRRKDTWQVQIEQRGGQDRFAFDSKTGEVSRGSDGLPEIVLRSKRPDGDARKSNVQLVNLGNGLRDGELARQVQTGLTEKDLDQVGGELVLTEEPLVLSTLGTIEWATMGALDQTIGRHKICLLYEGYETDGRSGIGRAKCVGLVAGRIMSVREPRYRECEVVVQPSVIATRTAVIGTRANSGQTRTANDNSYIYKLHLTN